MIKNDLYNGLNSIRMMVLNPQPLQVNLQFNFLIIIFDFAPQEKFLKKTAVFYKVVIVGFKNRGTVSSDRGILYGGD
jgi:hypothetical protein